MQTFLPYPSFEQSAAVLDRRRAWKQVVEAAQILNVISTPHITSRWRNHPAVLMWVGYKDALTRYYNVFWRHCVDVHKVKAKKLQLLPEFTVSPRMPAWFGRYDFHRSHRSNLLRKDFNFYSRFHWSEPANLPYVWPTKIV